VIAVGLENCRMNAKIEASPITADELVGALDALGVSFLSGGVQTPRALALLGAELLLGLARDPDERVRLSVISLLLVRPGFTEVIPGVAEQLDGDAKRTFECYCGATHGLQREHQKSLKNSSAS
jgi:hypothetical protein